MLVLRKISGIRNTFPFYAAVIALVWLSGLLFGAYILCKTDYITLIDSLVFSRISIVGLCLSLIIPLLLSYILIRHQRLYFIFPVVFFKAITFFCCYGSLWIIYQNAGWLICWMVMFSDFFLVILLLFLWYRAATGKKHSYSFNILVYIVIPFTIVCIDYFYISPCAAKLLNF